MAFLILVTGWTEVQAVILVGGLGTRLRPLTINTPKAMVPVLNKPFLEYVLLRLKDHGVDEVILTLSHLAPPIEACFGDGRRLGLKIDYVLEQSPLGTAGAVKNTQKLISGSFLVLNGDIFTDLDVSAMLAFHRQRKATATIALTPVADPTSYGLIETDGGGRVNRFLEKPRPEEVTTNLINAGTYVLEPEVLDCIPPATNYSFERQLFPGLLRDNRRVYAYNSPAYWIDIGSPEKYRRLNSDLLVGQAGRYSFRRGNEVVVGSGSRVHPTACLTGPLLIGSNCTIGRNVSITGPSVIGPDCRIEDGATITASIVWQEVAIEAGCRITGCIVANGCELGAGCEINSAVMGDHVRLACDYRLEFGGHILPGAKLG